MITYEKANDPVRVRPEGRAIQEHEEVRSVPQEPAQGGGGKKTKRSRPPLTVERLREVLDYDPETGVFRWKVSVGAARAGNVASNMSVWGYLRVRIDLNIYPQHVLAWLITYGVWPDTDIDHINQIKHDNRISNLRLVSRSENNHNSPAPKNNTSGVKGVEWTPKTKKWRSSIVHNKNKTHLGYFSSKQSAIAARKAAEIKYFPEIYKPAGNQRSA